MTNIELRAWITGRALTIKAAAEMLGLSEDGLAHQLNGRRKVSEQTRQLCLLWDAYDGELDRNLDAAEREVAKGYQIGKRDAKPTEEPR